MIYSNFRLKAEFDNWPYGRTSKTDCVFEVEKNSKGERAFRTTRNPKTGKWMKPKATTYAEITRIADGPEGKTYIVQLTSYGFISVTRSDLNYSNETIHPENPRFKELFEAIQG